MNPTLDAKFLEAERKRDPEFFAREYLAEFWESASQFLPAEMVDAAIVPDRYELVPHPDIAYTAAREWPRGARRCALLVKRTWAPCESGLHAGRDCQHP